MLKSIQATLTVRQGFVYASSEEHKNLQQYVNLFETINATFDINVETDNAAQRAEKLNRLKIEFAKTRLVI